MPTTSNPLCIQPAHLVLNCSEDTLQVVLGNREKVLWAQNIFTSGQAMRHISPTISSGMDSLEINPHDLAGISCVRGPGSFTGIRMIFAHAHGLALAADIPMNTISYFDALVHGPGNLLNGIVWVFIHSRRNQVYGRAYSLPSLQALSDPVNIDLKSNNLPAVPGQGQNVYAFGSGVRKNPAFFSAAKLDILPIIWDTPLPGSLLQLSLNSSFSNHLAYPQYLRLSDAQENLPSFPDLKKA